MKKTQAFLVTRGLGATALAGTVFGLFFGLNQLAPPKVEAPEPEPEPVVVVETPTGALAEVEATQPETCQVAVRVLRDGAPTDGASLSLRLVDGAGTSSTWEAITDEGVHRFVDLPRGSFHLSASLDDRAMRTGPEIACYGDESRFFLDLDLSEVGTPITVVPRSAAGALTEGAEVLIAQERGAQSGLKGIVHLNRGDAGFTGFLAPGRYEMMTIAPNHTPHTQRLIVGDKAITTKPRLIWRPEASGTVVDAAGQPVANARIFLGPRVDPRAPLTTTTTDDQGRFVLPVPPSTGLVVTAWAEEGIASVKLGAPSKPAGHPDLAIQLREGRTASGFVTKRNGTDHAFGKVRYRIKELGIEGVAKADQKGAFALPQMPKQLDVELWAEDSAIGAWGGRVSSPESPRVMLQWVAPAYAKQ